MGGGPPMSGMGGGPPMGGMGGGSPMSGMGGGPPMGGMGGGPPPMGSGMGGNTGMGGPPPSGGGGFGGGPPPGGGFGGGPPPWGGQNSGGGPPPGGGFNGMGGGPLMSSGPPMGGGPPPMNSGWGGGQSWGGGGGGGGPGPGMGPPPANFSSGPMGCGNQGCGGPGGCGGCSFGAQANQQQTVPLTVNVEVEPEVTPNFQKGYNLDTFLLEVPAVIVRIKTSCQPQPPMMPGMTPFKPYEEFPVQLPAVMRVEFNPRMNQPQEGRIWTQVQKRGAVMEFPTQCSVDAKLKTNSPYGSLILEDVTRAPMSGFSQKIADNVLNWRLQVNGQLSVAKGTGNMGANRLEVELNFLFDCYMGGPPVAQPQDDQTSGMSTGMGIGMGVGM